MQLTPVPPCPVIITQQLHKLPELHLRVLQLATMTSTWKTLGALDALCGTAAGGAHQEQRRLCRAAARSGVSCSNAREQDMRGRDVDGRLWEPSRPRPWCVTAALK